MNLNRLCAVCLLVVFALYVVFWNFEAFIIHDSKQHVIVFNIGASLVVLASLFGNVLILTSMCIYTDLHDVQMYLVVMMAVADLMQCLFSVPVKMTIETIMFTDAWLDININTFYDSIKIQICCWSGFSALSITSFAIFCICRLVVTLKQSTSGVTLTPKFVCGFIAVSYSICTALLYYKFFDRYWHHIFESIVILFFPVLLTAGSLASIWFLEKRDFVYQQRTNQINQTAVHVICASYVILWTPYFVMTMMNKYCCSFEWNSYQKVKQLMECLMATKTFTTPIIFAVLDQNFNQAFKTVLTKCCCFCSSQTRTRITSVGYSVPGSEISMTTVDRYKDFNDKEELLTDA